MKFMVRTRESGQGQGRGDATIKELWELRERVAAMER